MLDAELNVVARERRLVGDRRIVERMHGYASGHGQLRVAETVGLSELFGDGEHGSLHEQKLVVAHVDALLNERERAKVGYAHALRLRHELVNVGGHLVPDLDYV